MRLLTTRDLQMVLSAQKLVLRIHPLLAIGRRRLERPVIALDHVTTCPRTPTTVPRPRWHLPSLAAAFPAACF